MAEVQVIMEILHRVKGVPLSFCFLFQFKVLLLFETFRLTGLIIMVFNHAIFARTQLAVC